MASATAVRAGRAFVEIFAEDSKAVRTLEGWKKRFKEFGEQVRSIGAKISLLGTSVAAGMTHAAKQFAESGSELKKFSTTTGVAAENLSELQYAASKGGVSFESLVGGIEELNESLQECVSGSVETIESFQRLGLSWQVLAAMSPEKRFQVVADRLSAIKNPTSQAAYAATVLGSAASDLVPLLQKGAGAIEAYRKEAVELGLVLSKEDVEAAGALQGAFGALAKATSSAWNQVGAAVAPILKETVDRMASLIRFAGNWVKQNREMVVAAFRVAKAVAAIGTGLLVISAVFAGVGIVAGAFAAVLTAIGTAFSLLLSPIGLVAAGIAIVAYQFVNWKALATDALSAVGVAIKDIEQVWDALTDAIGSGNTEAAMEVAAAAFSLAWAKAMGFVQQLWASAKQFFTNVWINASYDASERFADLWGKLKVGFIAVVGGIKIAWGTLFSWIHKAFIDVTSRAKRIAAMAAILMQESLTGQKVPDIAKAILNEGFKLEAEQEKKQVDRDFNAGVEENGEQQLQAERERQNAIAELRAARDAALKANEGGADLNAADAAKQVQDAQARLDKAIKAAKALTGGRPGRTGTPENSPFTGMPQVGATVVGTFSSAAVRGLGGGNGAITSRLDKEIVLLEQIRKVLYDHGDTAGMFT